MFDPCRFSRPIADHAVAEEEIVMTKGREAILRKIKFG
jgi:hypothetical protein